MHSLLGPLRKVKRENVLCFCSSSINSKVEILTTLAISNLYRSPSSIACRHYVSEFLYQRDSNQQADSRCLTLFSLPQVRRKIKNKLSAQESRRKKKEYVEKLEKK